MMPDDTCNRVSRCHQFHFTASDFPLRYGKLFRGWRELFQNRMCRFDARRDREIFVRQYHDAYFFLRHKRHVAAESAGGTGLVE
jgi:hypothetical protein